MNRTRILLVVAVASLVAVPAIARAADYHHVHLTTSNATEAVKWYERYLVERPLDLADVEVLTPEQAAARRARGTLGSIWGYESEWRDTTLGYVKSAPSRQVAMVIDPPDGRIPPMTPGAKS